MNKITRSSNFSAQLPALDSAAAPNSGIDVDCESSRKNRACAAPQSAAACGKALGAVPVLTVACTPPAPQLIVHSNQPACGGAEYVYQLPHLQMPATGCEHVVPVEYNVGGNVHHVYAGDLHVAGTGTIAVAPRINMAQDEVHVHHPQAVHDARGQFQVAQAEAQLLCAAPAAALPAIGKGAYAPPAAIGKGYPQGAIGKDGYANAIGKGGIAQGIDKAGAAQGAAQGASPDQGGVSDGTQGQGGTPDAGTTPAPGTGDGEVIEPPQQPGDERPTEPFVNYGRL